MIDLDEELALAGASKSHASAKVARLCQGIEGLVAELREARVALAVPRRKRLPKERRGINHHFTIGGHDGYVNYNTYEDDGQLAEFFIVMAKTGSTMSGLMDNFSLAASVALQYGVPLKFFCKKFIGMAYDPSGPTNNPDIQVATSIVDYVFTFFAKKFGIKVEDCR